MCADTSVSVLSRTRGFISYYIYYNVDICLEVYVLANIKSAKKRVLIAEVRNARNKAIKSGVKTAVKKVEAAVAAGDKENAQKELLNATPCKAGQHRSVICSVIRRSWKPDAAGF